MDGTMINNMPYHKKAWKEFLKRHAISFTDDEFQKKISGKKNDEIFRIVFKRELTAEENMKYTEEKEDIYRELYTLDIREINGLSDIIAQLQSKGVTLAIATTAPEKNRQFGLHALGLENKFTVILGDEHVSKGKPDPEIYVQTAKMLNINPENCLVFEDSPPGVAAGKHAGMRVVAILSTHTKEQLHEADYFVHNYTEISFT